MSRAAREYVRNLKVAPNGEPITTAERAMLWYAADKQGSQDLYFFMPSRFICEHLGVTPQELLNIFAELARKEVFLAFPIFERNGRIITACHFRDLSVVESGEWTRRKRARELEEEFYRVEGLPGGQSKADRLREALKLPRYRLDGLLRLIAEFVAFSGSLDGGDLYPWPRELVSWLGWDGPTEELIAGLLSSGLLHWRAELSDPAGVTETRLTEVELRSERSSIQ